MRSTVISSRSRSSALGRFSSMPPSGTFLFLFIDASSVCSGAGRHPLARYKKYTPLLWAGHEDSVDSKGSLPFPLIEAIRHVADYRSIGLRQFLVWFLALRVWPEIGHDVLQAAKEFLGVALA